MVEVVKKVTMWKDRLGNLHETKEAAEAVSVQAVKTKIIADVGELIYKHMFYDEFDCSDFVYGEADELLRLLNEWVLIRDEH